MMHLGTLNHADAHAKDNAMKLLGKKLDFLIQWLKNSHVRLYRIRVQESSKSNLLS